METKLTGKHLAVSTIVGLCIVFFIAYKGLDQQLLGSYYYEGPYNSHDAAFSQGVAKANPKLGLHAIVYSEQCSSCHLEAFEPVTNDTCNQCHPTLKPGSAKFKEVAYNYHERVKAMDCSACHRIHEFREVEATQYYGKKFNHALMVPGWKSADAAASDCASCHAPFDSVGRMLDVLRSTPQRAEWPLAQVEADAARYLTDAAKAELRLAELGLSAGSSEMGAKAALVAYDKALVDQTLVSGRPVLLYFRSAKASAEGGVCRYLEDEVFPLKAVSEALSNYAIFAVDWEKNPEAWRERGIFRAGSVAIVAASGEAVEPLHFFNSPTQLLGYLAR